MAVDACEIDRRVWLGAVALGLPQHFAQAVEQYVLGGVLVAALLQQLPVAGGDAARLVDGELLTDRQVQRQVQKRVGLTVLRQVIAFQELVGIIELGGGIRDAAASPPAPFFPSR
jgi:hypothetical protein